MKSFFLVVFVGMFCGCAVFDESETLPAFLNFDDVSVSTTSGQGAETQNISDVWVAVDGQNLGVFPLPNVAPALFENQKSTIDVFAGVRSNGIRESAIIYPFYDRVQLDLALTAGENIDIPLEFVYAPATDFRLAADFESQNPFTFDEDEDGVLGFGLAADDPADGSQSGMIQINEIGKVVEVGTERLYQLPFDSPVFLEMDYKGDMELLIGTSGISGNTIFKNFFIVLRPQSEWNKIYIDLSNEVAQSRLQAYRIILGARLDNQESGQVFVDNIKLLHF